jgi:hypothetical protein
MAVSGTVEVRPWRSQRTVAVPAFASTDCTRPSSPVAFLRTWPGGRGDAEVRRSRFAGAAGVGDAGRPVAGFRRRRFVFGAGCSSVFSSGTMFAPVPFVSVSSTQGFAITLNLAGAREVPSTIAARGLRRYPAAYSVRLALRIEVLDLRRVAPRFLVWLRLALGVMPGRHLTSHLEDRMLISQSTALAV